MIVSHLTAFEILPVPTETFAYFIKEHGNSVKKRMVQQFYDHSVKTRNLSSYFTFSEKQFPLKGPFYLASPQKTRLQSYLYH